MNKKDRIEEYLAEVVDRLMDTERALEAVMVFCGTRKETMINAGKSFGYDQGRIDGAREVLRFATGEDSLKDLMEIVKEQQTYKELGMDVV